MAASRFIPAKIHFICVGKTLTQEEVFMIERLATVASSSNFELNLWIEPTNLDTQALVDGIPNLNVRSVESLLDEMENHPIVEVQEGDSQAIKEARKKSDATIRERFKNNVRHELSENREAATSLLSYEILRQEGGYYFSLNKQFILPEATKIESAGAINYVQLHQDAPPLGILLNFDPQYGRHGGVTGAFRLYENARGDNDIIACEPNHEVMNIAIKNSVAAYEQLNNCSSQMSPNQLYNSVLLWGAFRTFWDKLPEDFQRNVENISQSTVFRQYEDPVVAGMTVQTRAEPVMNVNNYAINNNNNNNNNAININNNNIQIDQHEVRRRNDFNRVLAEVMPKFEKPKMGLFDSSVRQQFLAALIQLQINYDIDRFIARVRDLELTDRMRTVFKTLVIIGGKNWEEMRAAHQNNRNFEK